ncbi:MAG: hypothetical protein JNK76_07040 [Planctomycetales bacterium]|nr:hypothetical protein [Planctomycetales bacterium]
MNAAYRLALVLLLGLGFSSPAAGQRIHALVAADQSPSAGWGKLAPNLTIDVATIRAMLAVNSPEAALEVIDATMNADADSTPAFLLSRVKELRPGPDDAVVFYFTGHGGSDDEGSYFQLAEGKLYRSTVRNLLVAKGSRLVVLLTDCCNSRSDGFAEVAPGFVESERTTFSPLFQSLFIRPRGIVDVNACAPGQAAFFLQSSPGSIFTTALGDWAATHQDEARTWDDALRDVGLAVHHAFRKEYPRGAVDAKGARAQLDQSPHAYDYPDKPPRSGPRTGLLVRDVRGGGAYIYDIRADSPATRVFAVASESYLSLRAGQLITAANGVAVTDVGGFSQIVKDSPQILRLTIRDVSGRSQEYLMRLRY